MRPFAKARRSAPRIETARLPAPVGGLNRVDPASNLPLTDCILSYNLIASEHGLRSRLGYREWCTGLTGASDNQVRTELPFTGTAKNGSADKLFANTSSGIWDVTASSAAPSISQAFTSTSGEAGWGTTAIMTTSAGRFLLYCDEVNGLYIYSETGGTWAQVTLGGGATQISGVDPINLRHVAVWKNRVWFTQGDTTKAWYLAANAVYGAATSFDFGPRMKAGGPLLGIWSWSYNGGDGLDSFLVGLSQGGDVVVYQGTDPSSATTFAIKGSWNVGGFPYGRRIALEDGGDLLLVSVLGLVPLSKLVVGTPTDTEKLYDTYKIQPLFALYASTFKSLDGWSLVRHPEENALLLTVPTASGTATQQLAMSLATRGWFPFRDLPIFSAAPWNGTLYFGTTDGRVCKATGYIDNVLLSDPNSYSAIGWSLLTAYSDLGNARQKRVHMVRPTLLSQTPTPLVETTARYDYDLVEPAPPSGGAGGDGSTWDTAVWDTAIWSGDYAPSQPLQGTVGMGRDVAVAIRGNAKSRTTLVKLDVFFEQGGFL